MKKVSEDAAYRSAEEAYRAFVLHALACKICDHAGGDAAEEKDLCRRGRILFRRWNIAEHDCRRIAEQN